MPNDSKFALGNGSGNASSNPDYFHNLFGPEDLQWSATVAIFSFAILSFCCPISAITIRFHTQVSRQSTLLTLFNCKILQCTILWLPIQALDTLRFSTGMIIPPLVCQAATYARSGFFFNTFSGVF